MIHRRKFILPEIQRQHRKFTARTGAVCKGHCCRWNVFNAHGHRGAFNLTINDLLLMRPSPPPRGGSNDSRRSSVKNCLKNYNFQIVFIYWLYNVVRDFQSFRICMGPKQFYPYKCEVFWNLNTYKTNTCFTMFNFFPFFWPLSANALLMNLVSMFQTFFLGLNNFICIYKTKQILNNSNTLWIIINSTKIAKTF